MFLQFVSEYWYLFAMLAAILLLMAFDPAGSSVNGASKISPAQLPQVQSRQSAVVVDVRKADEFKQGHIAQSINLPLDTMESSMKKLNKHKSKPLILVCQTGAKAGKSVNTLKKNGFSDLFVLDGGIAAWSKENLPLTRS